ncbi:MAG TPA: tRNA epoxyqueuosine(34) reductase QueG [Chthoniobacteraceae bacterium]|jgi:epoxyqueuosine reductase
MASCAVKSELVAFAESLGFDLCRIAECVTPPHAEEFRTWLAEGRAGEMSWLERNQDRRTDPQLVLPGARSVVVLAMNYWQGEEVEGRASKVQGPKSRPPSAPSGVAPRADPRPSALEARPASGKIARYAWGDDYHDLLEKKLRALDEWLTARGGRQRCYVDTGPILERDFAALAGAGWHGKSTMLIHPKLGTWFFLAEVLTTLQFAPDPPLRDHCGSCTRCMVACPTAAITSPQQLDARRCISYLTIESKGSIPLELRPLIGDRIYGCDDCLAACPWNRFARASNEAAFAAREFVHEWKLRDYLALDEEGFRQHFRKSPIKRVKRRGLLRNVCVALGNVGTSDDLPALERAAEDPEPLIAEHAQWAIGRIRARHPQSLAIA